MHVVTRCPHCGQRGRVPEAAIGRPGRCPKCRGEFIATNDGPADTNAGPVATGQGAATGSGLPPPPGGPPSSSARGPEAAAEPTIGRIGRFELRAALGAGAFGRVYRAFDPILDRQVALKVPRFPPDEPGLAERFFREARAAARLRHPNIVAVFESGRAGDDVYIASEFVPGMPLSIHMAENRPDFETAARLVRDLARGLAYAHDEGVIHRDIKPANIMIGRGDRPQLMDFGLAKRVDDDATMTSEGSVLGTPAYMSPEQARGDVKAIGPRSDLYSLGVVLYEMLAARKPFEGPSHSVIAQVIADEPPAPRKIRADVPRDLEAVCLKAMEKNPARRYANASDLATDLDRWLAGDPTAARPIGPAERFTRWARKRPAVAGLTAAVFFASLTGTAVSTYFKVQADLRAADATQSAEKARLSSAEAEQRRKEAEASSEKAEASAAESNRQLVRFHVASGARALDSGDRMGALLSFASAWQTDRNTSTAAGDHRTRLGSLLSDLPPLVGLCMHDGPVQQASFSPDGTRVLTCIAGDTAAYVWDPLRSRLATPRLDHGMPIRHASWSPDGGRIATVATGPLVKVWDARRGGHLHALRHPRKALWATFDPKQGRLATSCEDGAIRFWDAAAGTEVAPTIQVGGPVEYFAFSPDGAKFVTLSRSGSARVWSTTSGQALTPALPQRAILSSDSDSTLKPLPSFSPDGKRLLTAELKRWHVWNPDTGARIAGPVTFPNPVAQLGWSGDGSRIVVCPSDHFLGVYRPDATELTRFPHPRSVYRTASSPDGRWTLNDMTGGAIYLWNLETLTAGWPEPQACAHHATVLAFSADSKLCLAGSSDGSVRVWSLGPPPDRAGPYAFDDGKAQRVVLRSPEGQLRVLHPGGRLEARLPTVAGQPVVLADRDGAVRATLPHTQPVVVGRFSGDGRLLVTVQNDLGVRAWTVDTAAPAGPAFALDRETSLSSLAFSDDARRLAVLGPRRDPPSGGRLNVWDVVAGRRLLGPVTMPGRYEAIFTANKDTGLLDRAAMSPDGKIVAAVGDTAAALAFWEVDTGRLLHSSPRRFAGYTNGLQFSDNGRRLLHYGTGQVAQVWNVPEGTPAGPPIRHTAALHGGALSPPGGEHVATVDASGPKEATVVRLWDGETGDLLHRFAGPKTVWFRADGASLLLQDGTGPVSQVRLPRFEAPIDQMPALVELLTARRLDAPGGFGALDPLALRAEPARYRRAWLAWRGLDDDPRAQPPPRPRPRDDAERVEESP